MNQTSKDMNALLYEKGIKERYEDSLILNINKIHEAIAKYDKSFILEIDPDCKEVIDIKILKKIVNNELVRYRTSEKSNTVIVEIHGEINYDPYKNNYTVNFVINRKDDLYFIHARN